MPEKKALIVTSIADDKHPILNRLAAECSKRSLPFIVIGDTKSPEGFSLAGCDFWSMSRQKELDLSLAPLTPEKHYSRKNLGYLIAMKAGVTQIIETDDDNIPREEFWSDHERNPAGHYFAEKGWVNVYSYFTEKFIWPRGFPLEELHSGQPPLSSLNRDSADCPIQQGLADENPDVDAVYRLTYPLPLSFEKKGRLLLGRNSWSPFNSQNTFWFSDAFPLLYLPSFCSFRMTDIWRSYVAQRVAWECGWSILYHEPTVWQERNEHNLMKDFADEIPGYTNNSRICKALQSLTLLPGKDNVLHNMMLCYRELIGMGVVGEQETALLEAWSRDLKKMKIC